LFCYAETFVSRQKNKIIKIIDLQSFKYERRGYLTQQYVKVC
jgi:hypothetical protein